MEAKTSIAGRREPFTEAGGVGPHVSWSRRRILANGSLSLGLALSLPRALSRPLPASPPPPVQEQSGTTGSSPAHPSATDSSPTGGSGPLRSDLDLYGRLTTAVWINGSGPFRFMVDTGAERTVLADDIAARLALPSSRRVFVQGIIRGEPEPLVEIRELRMGSLVSSSLQVPTLPRAMIVVDGFLGLDVLDHRRVVFDFVRHTLTVTKPQGFFSWLFAHDGGVRVHTLGNSGRLRSTDCVIDTVHAAAFFDTGAELSIVNPALYEALLHRNAKQTVRTTEVLTGVTGGSVEGGATLLDMVILGDLVLTFTEVVVADLPIFALWGLRDQPALLIGMDCLRRCARVSIDYRRKELSFELASVQMPPALQAGLAPPLPG